MNEIFLVLVSYVIIATFLAIETCIYYATSFRYAHIVRLLNQMLRIFIGVHKFNVKPCWLIFFFFFHFLLLPSCKFRIICGKRWFNLMRNGIISTYMYAQRNRDTTATNGCTLIFVYVTYTMLPVRLREALIGGLLLSILHIYLGVFSATQISWTEVSELGADGFFFR